MAKHNAGIDAGVRRFGGTDLDHEIRGAANTMKDAQRHLEKVKAAHAARVAAGEAEIALQENALKEAEERMTALQERKKKEEPGLATPGIRRSRLPGGVTKEEWAAIRIAGKAGDFRAAVAAGEEAAWLESFRAGKK